MRHADASQPCVPATSAYHFGAMTEPVQATTGTSSELPEGPVRFDLRDGRRRFSADLPEGDRIAGRLDDIHEALHVREGHARIVEQ